MPPDSIAAPASNNPDVLAVEIRQLSRDVGAFKVGVERLLERLEQKIDARFEQRNEGVATTSYECPIQQDDLAASNRLSLLLGCYTCSYRNSAWFQGSTRFCVRRTD